MQIERASSLAKSLVASELLNAHLPVTKQLRCAVDRPIKVNTESLIAIHTNRRIKHHFIAHN
jgi:hypothetical protein